MNFSQSDLWRVIETRVEEMKKADRLREIEESDSVITEKCKKLANFLRNSKCTLVYTGAGISTAASIPDYRGPNGVWTLAEKGITVSKCGDPVQSCPTTSHMVLKEMCRRGIVRHILSQNCDGLHLRSGVPQKMLSEIHGNMHIEVCTRCDPPRQFIRPFDVTQKSQFRRHGTGRVCTVCNTELVDTIVHFGEVGRVPWPLNWRGVTSLIDECDLILCVGTSLAVLKQYQFLWPKTKSHTQIAIVNLQWTPKDRFSCLKINAKCDTVFEKLAKMLSVPVSYYCRDCDPVLNPRRNARICEIRERLTDCSCHLRVPRSTCTEQGPRGTPGWWTVGIQKTIRRSLQSAAGQGRRSVGRPRKRKKLDNSRRNSLEEEELAEKLPKFEDLSPTNSLASVTAGDSSSGISDFAVSLLSNDEISDIEIDADVANDHCCIGVDRRRFSVCQTMDGEYLEAAEDAGAIEFEVRHLLDEVLAVLLPPRGTILLEGDVE
uniref:protein acetyllysine N-acetyltransferase n=2 Tax=Parascaris univalens TaxID=6257 RepID=A0A915C0H9_PARUN